MLQNRRNRRTEQNEWENCTDGVRGATAPCTWRVSDSEQDRSGVTVSDTVIQITVCAACSWDVGRVLQ